ASCTGLSILLADACRAFCVPARAVGTQWTKTAGNHTWVEVWDRQWNFVGACEPAKLNHTWFFANASQADATKLEHRIFAASYAKTGQYFPLVWKPDDKDVSGIDVTAFYTHRGTLKLRLLDKPDGQPQSARVDIRCDGELVASAAGESSYQFDLALGEKYTAAITPAGGKTVSRQFTFPAEGDRDISLATADSR
ncbi:MAG TPA: transglutaminase domain-containing protein, partial [Pirellulales bacterium]|nr:transglutaminase domain-containing protein [Pirellulales bacterium]